MPTTVKIYIVISILCCVSTIVMGFIAKARFRQTYATAKLRPVPIIERIFSLFRVLVMSCVPILNILMLMTYIFLYDKVIEKTVYNLVGRIERKE